MCSPIATSYSRKWGRLVYINTTLDSAATIGRETAGGVMAPPAASQGSLALWPYLLQQLLFACCCPWIF